MILKIEVLYMLSYSLKRELMGRLKSEELNFILWRFFVVQIRFLIQWKILNLMISNLSPDSLGIRF